MHMLAAIIINSVYYSISLQNDHAYMNAN